MLQTRLTNLRTTEVKYGFSVGPVRPLATVDSSEVEIHRRFAHLRLAGEWYMPAPELMSYIEAARA